MSVRHKFGVIDYIVFGITLLYFIGIGVYYGLRGFLWQEETQERRKPRSTQKLRDFLTAESSHRVLPAIFSMFAIGISPTTLIGTPTSVYFRGTQYAVTVLVFLIAITFSNYIFVPVFYNLKLKSTLAYLEGRFDEKVRVIAVVLYSVNQLLMMASWLFVPAFAVLRLTDFEFWACVVITGCVGVFYTSLGGMRALLKADLVHLGIIVLSLLSMVVKGLALLGGFGAVFQENMKYNRIYIDDFDPNPFTYKVTFWTVTLSGAVYYSMIYSTYQNTFSLYMPAATIAKARRILWMQVPLLSAVYLLSCLFGVVVFAYYHTCDPFLVRRISRIEELMPLFASDIGGHIYGFVGFFIAGLFSGALSSMSSSLNSLATLTFEDIVKRFLKAELTDKQTTIYVRTVAIVYGLLTMSMVSVVAKSPNTLRMRQLISNMFASPLFAVYVIGVLNPRSTSKGVIIALLAGVLFGLFLLIEHLNYYTSGYAPGVTIQGCIRYYCNATGNMTPGCNITSANATEVHFMKRPEPTSAPITTDFEFIHRVSYHLGGVFTFVFTLIVATVFSPFFKDKKSRTQINYYLAPFIQDKRLPEPRLQTEDESSVSVSVSVDKNK